jgi:predicted metal-dependent hydrolase
MKKSVQFGSKLIEYSLVLTKRKSLGITVTPEMDVIVKAPLDASLERINTIVHKRAPWILKQQSFFLAFFPKQPPKKYISGETHLYLGRQYRLKVKTGKKEMVRISGRFLEVTSRGNNRARAVLKQWYHRQASIKFDFYAQEWIERFERYKVAPKAILLRSMKKRWGSCTDSKKIILNPELIKASKGCIEYVIAHELCHLVHRHHNQKFIDLQSRIMPNWERWKMRLEQSLA